MSRNCIYLEKEDGFTFMEMIVVLVIMGVLAALGMRALDRVMRNIKFESTLSEMEEIKKAIVGDPEAIQNNVRASFGYFGDMGSLPSTLNDLITKGSQPLLQIDDTLGIAYGWNGPYLLTTFTQDASGKITDGFGTAYVYSTAKSLSADGDSVYATITSYAADGSAGGAGVDADIILEIFKSDLFGSVYGNIYDIKDFSMDKATVTLYFSNGVGGLGSSAVASSNEGFYYFARVPFGINALTVIPFGGAETNSFPIIVNSTVNPQPSIFDIGNIFIDGTPKTKGGNDEQVEFKLRNELGLSITVVDFRATYTHPSKTPTYDMLEFEGDVHWQEGGTRAGSGDRLALVPGGTWTNSFLSNDNNFKFLMLDFRDGGTIDMRGINFEVRIYLSTGQFYDFSFTP